MIPLLCLFTLLSIVAALPIPGFLLQKPEQDPFYSVPHDLDLDTLANGQVYNSRQVFDSIFVDATLTKVEQVAYKTINTQNQSSHSVATVFTPLKLADDKKILSYQIYEDAANLECSPSYALATDLLGDEGDITISILTALSKGWYVIVPDHEGPRSAFIAGYEQGQAGLDGIKAGINYLNIDKKTPVSMLGYSGGASATAWMATLQPSYAPELNVVGAAHGGTPIDIIDMINYLDKADSLFSAFIVPAFAGLLSAYPGIEKADTNLIKPELRNAIGLARKPGMCFLENVITFEHQDWHKMTTEDIFKVPNLQKLFERETLLSSRRGYPVAAPTFPRYIWHAVGDEVIPIDPVNQYVNEQCSQGANIQYVKWNGDDHLTTEYLGLPDALKFTIEALEGKTPSVKCGTPSDDILTMVSHDLADWVGDPIADIIKGLSKVTTPFGSVILNITNGYQP